VSSVAGNWNATINSPMGAQEAAFTFVTEGEAPSGTATQNGATTDLANVALDGDSISFTLAVTSPMPLDLEFALTADGDALSGSAKAGFFPPMSVTGERA
jgi:hypothetical protein